MPDSNAQSGSPTPPKILRDEWLQRLNSLLDRTEDWADELGWPTRRIDKRMQDSEIGAYTAPALLLQEETTRLLLEPISRTAPGVDGIVELYLMPAYDDIASLFFVNGEWRVHYVIGDASTESGDRVADSRLLSKEAFQEAVEQMRRHAASL